jgi:peptidoglycan/LPS O-acetylase OafA/YrhL
MMSKGQDAALVRNTAQRSAQLPEAVSGRPATNYLPALDGLRAVAITLVVISHMTTPVRFGGQLAGYLITSILLSEHRRSGTIDRPRFYIRRLIRLYPALLVALIVLLIPGLVFAPSALRYVVENILAVTYTMPIALQVDFGSAWAWRHSWSLGIEEFFYLLWPTVLLIGLRKGRPSRGAAAAVATFGIALLLVAVALSWANAPGSLFLRSGAIFVGCALAVHLAAHPQVTFRAWFGWAGFMMIAAGVLLDTFGEQEPTAALLASVGTLGVVAHIVTSRHSNMSTALGVKPLAYVGRISYELYLFHYPVLIILVWALGTEPINVALLAAPIAIVLSVLTHALLAPRIDRWKSLVRGHGR